MLFLICLGAAVGAHYGLGLLHRHSELIGLRKTNFEGNPITGSMGGALCLVTVTAYLFAALSHPGQAGLYFAFALVGIAGGGLGYLDDRLGSRSVGGFRGHFGELLQGRMTTGAAKAIFLPAVAMLAALFVLRQSLASALLTTALVALSANTLNLLDVRPARAVTAWLAGAAIAIVIGGVETGAAWPVIILVGPVLVYLPWDAGRKGMLGDAGANFLGAVLGLQVGASGPVALRVFIAVLLLAVQVYSESHSLSSEIEKRRWLRWLDFFNRTAG